MIHPPPQPHSLQTLYKNIPQSIIANFSTRLPQYQITDSSQIDINTQFDQNTLNKIVKQLINSDQQTQNIFDFLVNGKILRGKLKSHLLRYQISCQQLIEIEYFIAFTQFNNFNQSPTQDWISCICQVAGLDNNIGVMSSLFNGTIEYHSTPSKQLPRIKQKIHQSVIKSIKTFPSQQQNIYYAITGGIDQQLKVSTFTPQSLPQIISVNTHEGSILGLDFNPTLDGHLCTVGSKGCLNIWKIPQNFITDEQFSIKAQKKRKKRKINHKILPHIVQQPIHNDIINCCCWFSISQLSTGSSDHSIKIIDIQKIKQHRFFLTKDSITTNIDFANDLLFTSHQDGYIRTWDLRNSSTNPLSTYKQHTQFASSVKSQPHSSIFATCSYDKTIKIWDTRSIFSLQTIQTNYNKVFAICWKNNRQLISGGSNPVMQSYSI